MTTHRSTLHNVAEMKPVIHRIAALLAQAGFSEKDQFAVRLSVEEAIVNGIRHGNREDPAKKVHVSYQVAPHDFSCRVEDEGPGFNPSAIADPLAPENLERPGGRGVFLMRHYMTQIQYSDRGNAVSLSLQARG